MDYNIGTITGLILYIYPPPIPPPFASPITNPSNKNPNISLFVKGNNSY
jgi:hypothetical protein